MRSPQWRQANPKDQLTVVFMALEGHRANLASGIITQDQFLTKTEALTHQMRELIQMQGESQWPHPEGRQGTFQYGRISTEFRGSDWIAILDNNARIWGCGKTELEAIGDCVKTHADKLGKALK